MPYTVYTQFAVQTDFYQPIRGFKNFLDSSDWLKKVNPAKKLLHFWTCNTVNNVVQDQDLAYNMHTLPKIAGLD